MSVTVRHEGSSSPRLGFGRLGAAVLAVLLHLALAKSLTVTSPRPAAVLEKAGPDCIMIDSRVGGDTWEKALYEWALVSDPTMLCLPHNELGFSTARAETMQRPFADYPPYSPVTSFRPETPTQPAQLPVRDVPVPGRIIDTWHTPALDLPAVPPVQLPRGIIWRRTDGTVLEHMAKVPQEQLRAALAEGEPGAPARIEILRTDGLVRVRLRQSSGNRMLDGLALRDVGRKVLAFEGLEQSFGKPEAGLFFPLRGEPSVVEVEWRLHGLEPPGESEETE